MTVVSLDKIVRNILMRRSYPLHYYITFLVYAKDGLATLAKDENIIAGRYKVLTLNDNHAIEIPNDYLDYTKVSMMNGQYLQPLVEDNSLNLVPNFDSTFEIQPYNEGVATDAGSVQHTGYLSPYWWTMNWNAYGENTGRQFGGVSAMSDTFRVNKARNEIKINEDLDITQVCLEYVSNGMDADSATQIDWYAKDCLEAYCMWQFKENNRTYSTSEAEIAKQEYIAQRLILRAELSDLTIDKLKRIVQGNTKGIKY